MRSLFESFIILLIIFTIIYFISYNYTKIKKNKKKKDLIKNYIGFVFVIFGLLKLYNLNKFVDIFSKYDILSNKFRLYGYFYPFIEILIGILLIKNKYIVSNLKIVLLLMIISIVSVIISIFNGLNLRCGCLGSFFHIPLSYTTLSENILMILMTVKYLYY